MNKNIQIHDLGLLGYNEAYKYQLNLFNKTEG